MPDEEFITQADPVEWASVPWDHPDANPMADLRALMRAWEEAEQRRRRGLDPDEIRRLQFEQWTMHHLLVCGGSFAFEKHNGHSDWIQCQNCNHRLILPCGESKMRGVTPAGVIVDELAFAEKGWQVFYTGSRGFGKNKRMQEAFNRERLNEWTFPDHPQAPEPGLLDLCMESSWLTPDHAPLPSNPPSTPSSR